MGQACVLLRYPCRAEWSCEQVRAEIDWQGDRNQWEASFDGFYLTREHHFNNSSATVHDMESHRQNCLVHSPYQVWEEDLNWLETSAGVEGNMLNDFSGKVKAAKFA